MEKNLEETVKVLESNYAFLQKEHTMLVKGLHQEIERLQRKYSDLTFDYTMRSNKSLETIILEDKIKKLQISIDEKDEEINKQKENLNTVCKRHKENETKLFEKIEEQKKTIENLKDIISQQGDSNRDLPGQSEKVEKSRKESQSEKVHKRKKKKSANSCAYENGSSPKLAPEGTSINVLNAKMLANKSSKSCTSSPPLRTIEYPTSENENYQKKGKKDGHKRGKKKCNSSLNGVGDIPILPSDYRAVVATLPPIVHSWEESSVDCEMHNVIPSCSSGRHTSYANMKSEVNTLSLSQLHKGLRKSSLKVESN